MNPIHLPFHGLRMRAGMTIGYLLGIFAENLQAKYARTVPVANNTQLSLALTKSLPGDCMFLANGACSVFTGSKNIDDKERTVLVSFFNTANYRITKTIKKRIVKE